MVEYELNSDFYNLASSLDLLINQNHHYITSLFVIVDSVTSEFEEFDFVLLPDDFFEPDLPLPFLPPLRSTV